MSDGDSGVVNGGEAVALVPQRQEQASDGSIVVVLITSGECADVARAARSCGAVALLAKQNINPAVLRGIWTIHGPV